MARQGFRRDPAKERFWRRAIARWGKCDLNVREFCGQEGLSQASFYWWRRELAKRDQRRQESTPTRRAGRSSAKTRSNGSGRSRTLPAFVPVRVLSDTSAMLAANTIEIALRSGHQVRVGTDVNAAALAQIVAVLEGQPC